MAVASKDLAPSPRRRRPQLAVVAGKPSARQVARRRHLVVTSLRATADLVAVALAMVLAFELKPHFPGSDPTAAGATHLALGLVSLPIWTSVFLRRHLYSEPHTANRLEEFHRVVRGSFLSVGLVAMAGFVLKLYVSRGWLVLLIPLAVVFVELEREVGKRIMSRLRRDGRHLSPVVIVGGNSEAVALCAMLASTPALGYRPVGFIDDEHDVGSSLSGDHRVLGRLHRAEEVARRAGATSAILATTSIDLVTSNRLARQLTEAGLAVELSSSLRDIAPNRLLVRPLGQFSVVHVEPVRRLGWRSVAKRAFDVAGASFVGLLTAPVLLLAALAIKLDSKGPVFFRQQRVGKKGRLFDVLKLRTMVVDAEALGAALGEGNQADGPLFKMQADPRVTRVGRVLRALSIDELPQLWNVVRGEMSMVGPRPALPREVAMWSNELHHRLTVQPGMTGMWQVSGSGRWTSFDEYARLDLYYVDNWSIWTDLAILLKTAPAVLFNRGGQC